MKQRIDLQLIATIGGGLLFNVLFWMEKQALNLLIYSLFILVIILIDPEKQKSKKLYLSATAHLLAAVLVIINRSELTIITWYFSLAVMVGFVHFHRLRSIFTSLFAAFLQFITSPVNLIKKILSTHFNSISFKPVLKLFKYIIIPSIAIIIFSALYSMANPVFADHLKQIINNLSLLITNAYNFFFADLDMIRFMHFVLGILITTGIFIGLKDLYLEKAETGCSEQLVRKRKNKKNNTLIYELTEIFAGSMIKRMMALKTENIIGIISLLALNLLLLSLNLIDITTLWSGKNTGLNSSNYSAELHDGTNALILSIIIAMLVIIYFFSGNLNFYRKNKTIRILAYLWIIQNAFLICSVLLRDFNYIHALGLTHKRIGVLVFLLLCGIGLTTVYIKVAKQKTFFYLCKVNGFAWYVLLLAFGFLNWDVFIVTYNIHNRDNIALDLDHLISLSDKTLPLLNENKEVLKKYLPTSSYAYRLDYDIVTQRKVKQLKTDKEQFTSFEEDLNQRIKNFKEQQDETSWLSWNYRDWQTQQYLVKNQL